MRLKYLFLSSIFSILLSFPLFAFAQREEADAFTGCFGCFGGCGGFILLIIIIHIALLVWVTKDAKDRKMNNPVLWMLTVLSIGLLGLLLYVLSRPKGNLVECENCKGKKLEYAKICPHCDYKSLEKNNDSLEIDKK